MFCYIFCLLGHNADAEVVNCVIDHPRDLAIATSGIDSDVKVKYNELY